MTKLAEGVAAVVFQEDYYPASLRVEGAADGFLQFITTYEGEDREGREVVYLSQAQQRSLLELLQHQLEGE